ncbi:unnamed protein product (macronuclear) [Paramecium tetraurelia]|uniref:Chromosome undetermined scaffold_161, whole genome shotgun sequence n=1 Tax=Paramecium tetraurelia TaxID=5888 RepID=A0CAB9_PARTE|nr:uncharacterized protein GSPATT00036516001 [Paramecium tetraurelia]XP_001440948.1 uncharacterized protein GSPATT00038901001 [Paramecium tetraurelia]CAK67736.1 unnamed protein product [Paramecium tetraurelia]CAK73551.1 unnamed protein product [Paramecium tetraurelia]|eukprot:XP_001435133.1 hypothetical protein (macronuclear) [Paramecium tetraurelia strain d4-2]
MGQAHPNPNGQYVKICTLCREQKPPHHFHCGKCRKKALIGFGSSLGLVILIVISTGLDLNNEWISFLSVLCIVSFFGGCYFCQSRLTNGQVNQYVEFYE